MKYKFHSNKIDTIIIITLYYIIIKIEKGYWALVLLESLHQDQKHDRLFSEVSLILSFLVSG